MIAALAIAALLVQEPPPQLSLDDAMTDPPTRAVMVDYFGAVGAVGYQLGACERFMPGGAADRMVSDLLQQAGFAAWPQFQSELRSTYADLYAQGRADPQRHTWTAEQCGRMLAGAVEDMETEGERLGATLTDARARLAVSPE